MTDRMELFVKYYVNNKMRNGTKAAVDAGYSEKTAYSQSTRLLKNVEVQNKITEYVRELLSDTEKMTLRWLEEVEHIAYADVRDLVDDEWDLKEPKKIKDSAAIVLQGIKNKKSTDKDGNCSVETSFKVADKNKALDLLGRFLEIGNREPITEEQKPDQLDHDERKDRLAYLLEKRVK